jgi:holliday junction DNA helicase ruvA
MIEFIKGEIAELTPTYIVIDTGGIGYMINITLTDYTALDGQKEARLLVHEAIREDACVLYGFLSEQSRSLFRSLIGVSGVGANTARSILSAVPADRLEAAIMAGDHNLLKKIKGIGAKTAQRIIVDLKDKIKPSGETLNIQSVSTSDVFDEALTALTILGYTRQESQKALKKIFDADPTVNVDKALRQALNML